MTMEEVFARLGQQNDVIIGLLARLVWSPEKIADMVTHGKRNPDAYRQVYNALDGATTGKALASMAGVTPPAISYLLKTWEARDHHKSWHGHTAEIQTADDDCKGNRKKGER